jgi:hypothetical protein
MMQSVAMAIGIIFCFWVRVIGSPPCSRFLGFLRHGRL